jgi:hypothetical protein
MTMTVDDEHAAVTARSALLYSLYAEAVDGNDLDALRHLVTDDVRITRGNREEPGGVEAFLDIYRAHIALGIEVCQHAVTNVIARPNGDVIDTRAYFQARLFEELRTRVLIGEYADVHAVRDGGLKIVHKRILVRKVLEAPAGQDVFTYAGTG